MDDDEGDGVDEGERAKLGVASHRENDVDVEKIVEETVAEEENEKIATPRVRSTVYDPLPKKERKLSSRMEVTTSTTTTAIWRRRR